MHLSTKLLCRNVSFDRGLVFNPVRELLTNALMNMEKRIGSGVILYSSTYWRVTLEVWNFMRLEQRTGERQSRREFWLFIQAMKSLKSMNQSVHLRLKSKQLIMHIAWQLTQKMNLISGFSFWRGRVLVSMIIYRFRPA